MNRDERRRKSRLRVSGEPGFEVAKNRKASAIVTVDEHGGGVVQLRLPVGTDEWQGAVWDQLSPDQVTDALNYLDKIGAEVTVHPWQPPDD